MARCFLRLADQSNFAIDRLNRYGVVLWRQVAQVLLTLDTLDRCKPQERMRSFNSTPKQKRNVVADDASPAFKRH
jgi:hypothetical protein